MVSFLEPLAKWGGISITTLIIVFFGARWIYSRIQKSGELRERQRSMQEIHDDVETAKRVEEAIRINTDADYAKRIRDKYMRD